MGWIPARVKDTGGFALAMAIFALVLLAAVIAGGYYSASQEYQIGLGMRSLTASFYAGEAGIREVLDSWDPEVYGALAPGDTVTVGPVTFEGGGSYTARVVRVGNNDLKRYFYIEAVGRPHGPSLGEHRQAFVVRARFPDMCCDFALRLFDQLDYTGNPKNFRIEGIDRDPPDWTGGICNGFVKDDTAAVSAGNPAAVAPDTAYLDGVPDWVDDYPALPQNVIEYPGYTWDDLVAAADHVFEDDDVSSKGDASLDANGECDRSDPYNWGEPHLPSHPCFDYFPIIHAKTNLTVQTGGRIQGIFLVEANTTLQNQTDVYGIILSRAKLTVINQSKFWGTGWVGDDVDFQGTKPEWHLSSCAARRALLLSNLARPIPVWPRPWVSLF
jgi:hypothetical protein